MELFDDIKVTYDDKSDKDLSRAYFLFRIISQPFITKILTSFLRIAIWFHLPIKGIIKATIYKQFCGGTSIEGSQETIDNLWKSRIGTILNFSAEGKETKDDFISTKQEIIKTIKKASQSKEIPFAVFKPTGITTFSLLEKLSKNLELSRKEQIEKKDSYNANCAYLYYY